MRPEMYPSAVTAGNNHGSPEPGVPYSLKVCRRPLNTSLSATCARSAAATANITRGTKNLGALLFQSVIRSLYCYFLFDLFGPGLLSECLHAQEANFREAMQHKPAYSTLCPSSLVLGESGFGTIGTATKRHKIHKKRSL
jgi:hypothetical protein